MHDTCWRLGGEGGGIYPSLPPQRRLMPNVIVKVLEWAESIYAHELHRTFSPFNQPAWLLGHITLNKL